MHTNTCHCNGKKNPDGKGGQDCQSLYHGKAHCYVDPGACSDETASKKLPDTAWSFMACVRPTAATTTTSLVASVKPYTLVGRGGCLDSSGRTAKNYYKFNGHSSAAWCAKQCTMLEACAAYMFITEGSNGHCRIYGQHFREGTAPHNWGFNSGSGGSNAITAVRAPGSANYACNRKTSQGSTGIPTFALDNFQDKFHGTTTIDEPTTAHTTATAKAPPHAPAHACPQAAVEIESFGVAGNGDWSLSTAQPGYSGDGYFTWTGADLFDHAYAGQHGLLTYTIDVPRTGLYTVGIRNFHSNPDSTEANDCFLKVNNNAWQKVYSELVNTWQWMTKEDRGHGDTEDVPTYYFAEGSNTIQISGRSHGFSIDRVRVRLASC